MADAELAALLQLEEQQQGQVVAAINRDLQTCFSCEDPAAQAAALQAMPLARLREEAAATARLNRDLGAAMQLGETDILVQNMALWFKGSFFTWMGTSTPCEACGGTAESQTMLEPTAEEAANGAGRVEGFVCASCGAVARFPRYTNPKKLLETRKGRCGEWAHAFLLLLRAAGLDARHVHDHADHVWVEYYSSHLGRWVHVDPCEAAFDTPLLYEQGWGKRYGLVVSSGAQGVADTTRRYTKDHAVALQRRRESEELSTITDDWMAEQVAAISQRLRAQLATPQRNELIVRDLAEAMQLMMPELSVGGSKKKGARGQQQQAAEEGQQQEQQPALPGRQSGPAAWRAARGEAGAAAGAGAGAAPVPPAGTPYELSGRGAPPLAPLYAAAGRLFSAEGGACRASGEHGRAEGVAMLFDGSARSKWLDLGGGGPGGQAWAEWRLPAAAEAAAVAHYALVSANDCPERDPAHVLLECVPAAAPQAREQQQQPEAAASTSGGLPPRPPAGAAASAPAVDADEWVVLDERIGVKFPGRGQLLSFTVAVDRRLPSRRWRLRALAAADPAAANSIQLAAWDAYTIPPAPSGGGGSGDGGEGACSSGSGGLEAGGSSAGHEGYLTSGVRRQLRAMAAAAEPMAAAAGGAERPAGDAAAAQLLRRIAGNLTVEPAEEKFFQLRGDKVAALLERPACAAALFAMGFRPLLLPPRPGAPARPPQFGAEPSQSVDLSEVGLVADHTAAAQSGSDGHAAARRAAAEVLSLLGATCA